MIKTKTATQIQADLDTRKTPVFMMTTKGTNTVLSEYKGKRTGRAVKHALAKKRRINDDAKAVMLSHYEFNPESTMVYFDLETGELC